jgi:nuclear transcription factor Y, gamma
MYPFHSHISFVLAVVAAAKSRGGGTLQPMTAAQIAALSQVQAQAIVHARKASAGTQQTPQQLQRQIQLQAQALVHAHTQAQIQAGIYKGTGEDAAASGNTSETGTGSVAASTAAPSSASSAKPPPRPAAGATQQRTQQSSSLTSDPLGASTTAGPSAASSVAAMTNNAMGMPASPHPGHHAQAPVAQANIVQHHPPQHLSSSTAMVPVGSSSSMMMMEQDIPQPSATSPQFLAQLHSSLNQFWQQSLREIRQLENQTEQDFKNHNDLPLARIKRIMKSDEDVRMISAEAPVLFAKACELFILDLSIRSWNFSQLHKRRTLQKEDVKEAIQKTDIFDFLVDVIQ